MWGLARKIAFLMGSLLLFCLRVRWIRIFGYVQIFYCSNSCFGSIRRILAAGYATTFRSIRKLLNCGNDGLKIQSITEIQRAIIVTRFCQTDSSGKQTKLQ